jgi:biopolymer transport protein ExbB
MIRLTRYLSTTRMATLLALLLVGGAIAVPLIVAPQPALAQAASTAPPAGSNAAPPSALVASGPTTEVVENPYGLDSLWRQGDYVARGTLLVLLIMSMGSWYIVVTKLFEQLRLMRQARAADKAFLAAGSVQEGIRQAKEDSPFRSIAESGMRALQEHKDMQDRIDLHTWVTMAIQRAIEAIQSRLQGGLAFLATVGSTAPFVGLFGTVWGIYHALTAIGIAGQASIDKVAGPVGEALIMTAFGLAVAVPAVLAYNWLVRRNKLAMEEVRGFGADVYVMLVQVGRTNAPASGVASVDQRSVGHVR